jgi:hypothetical protein
MITYGRMTGRVPSILRPAQEYRVSHRTSKRAPSPLANQDQIVAVPATLPPSSATRASPRQ